MKNITPVVCFLLATIIGQSTVAQICPGTPGQVQWEAWLNLYDDELEALFAEPTYPAHPAVTKPMYSLATAGNYDDYFGCRVRGFIKVDTTTIATFNVTGNDIAHFYLSADGDPQNKALIAYTDDDTGTTEHDNFPTQTSTPITLVAGQYYYFELYHVERAGWDHATVYWKNDLLNTTDWAVISSQFIAGVDCLPAPCPPLATPCDDGDPSTLDDQEDGYCNCVGIATTSNTCVADRGDVTAYRYTAIPGGDLTDLYVHPDFPAMPVTSEERDRLSMRYASSIDDAGHLVQGYLTVPVTGTYFFNVTGDDETIVFLSSDDDPANKQAHQCFVSGWTNLFEHDKYLWQTMGGIPLVAGQPYYYEVNNKQGSGGMHWSLFWKTPFTAADQWKHIPDIYLSGYDCSIACIPAGTPCDDGDPFTNNDTYDSNCTCVGTPCSGPDCDSPLASYVPFDKCGLTGQVDNNQGNNWQSCVKTTSPNPIRPVSHWLQYDLSMEHNIFSSQVWNYNVAGMTQDGFSAVAVDYSTDGTTWTELGTYMWPLASGDSNYSGFVGPNFGGVTARYILITSLDNDSGCKGLSKVAFTAIDCPNYGLACDDGDPNTTNDMIDSDCICQGIDLLVNDCDETSLVLGDSLLTAVKYDAINDVQSISTVPTASRVGFVGGKSVLLDVGFETQPNTVFSAVIDTCEDNSGNLLGQELLQRSYVEQGLQAMPADLTTMIEVIDIPEVDEQLVRFYIEEEGPVRLKILGMDGKTLYVLVDNEYPQRGLYTKRIGTKKLAPGNYSVVLATSTGKLKAPLSVEGSDG